HRGKRSDTWRRSCQVGVGTSAGRMTFQYAPARTLTYCGPMRRVLPPPPPTGTSQMSRAARAVQLAEVVTGDVFKNQPSRKLTATRSCAVVALTAGWSDRS